MSVTRLSVGLSWRAGEVRPVGTLAARDRRIYFAFDPGYLERPLPLSLSLGTPRAGLLQAPTPLFGGLHGVFDDSLPDGWGRLLIHRRAAARGLNPAGLTPLDLLAVVGHHAMGALVYEPADAEAVMARGVDLDAVAAASRAVLRGAPDDLFPELLRLGGSPGGARPKAVVLREAASGVLAHGAVTAEPGWTHWLVKFRGRDDPADIGPIEQAYAAMARAAGLTLPETTLLASGRRGAAPYFAAARFDRVGHDGRLHMHSACGQLHADFRAPSLDYRTLLALTLKLTGDQEQARQMLRRAAFNVLAHNRDDHSRQFAHLMDADGRWRLAPAFDLTFADGPGGEHATAVMGQGRAPGLPELLALAAELQLRAPDARALLDEVRAAVDQWRRFAAEAGVGRASTVRIAQVIAPRGRPV